MFVLKRMSRGWNAHSLLIALSSLAGAAYSGLAMAATELDPVVVTATRTERTAADAPVRIEVVSSAELERTHARTLKEALEDVPGLQLRPIHGKAGFEASLQGLSGEQVLVLIDGLPLTATTGSTVDLSQIALADVERVEVVKGAMSAQYGSAAMGGVINVITRDIDTALMAETRFDGGSYGNQNPSGEQAEPANRHGRFRVQGGMGDWRLRLAADSRNSAGIDPEPETWARPGDAIRRRQLNLRSQWLPDAQRSAYVDLSQFRESVSSRYVFSLPGREVPQERTEEVERLRISGGGRWQLPRGYRLRLDALTEELRIDTLKNAQNQSFDDRDADLGLTQATLLLDMPEFGNHLVQWGLTYHAEDLAQALDGVSELRSAEGVSRVSQEIFVQDDWQLGGGWELLLGARHQQDSDFGGFTAPKLNLRGHLLERPGLRGTLRMGWAQGYRVPNLKERNFRFDHSALGYVVVGNANLQPETSNSWQLGWRMDWHGGHWLDLNLFQNQLQDLIQVDSTNAPVVNGIQQFTYENISRASTEGVEVAAYWQAGYWLGISAAWTAMQTRDEDSGQALTRRPDHQARLGADWQPTPKLQVVTRLRYQSDELIAAQSGERSPAWTVLDASLNYDWSDSLRLLAGVNNLLDAQRDFNDPFDFGPIAGRFAYVGLRYLWQAP